MSRKHFEALAENLRAAKIAAVNADRRVFSDGSPGTHVALVDALIQDMAEMCDRFNENFDSGRFVSACNKI
jgi:hypothetical protein